MPPNELFAQFADALENGWRSKALPHQIEPEGDWWSIWAMIAGRGAGKTRSGSEWVLEQIAAGKKRVALIAPTAADARDVMIEGESGILACAPDWNRPIFEPSKRRITWSNGATGTLFSAEEPERLRGPQFECAWCDEVGAWANAEMTWNMMSFGLRLGAKPRVMVTTTPRPTKLLRDIIAREGRDVAITRASTFANSANLAPSFLETVERQYGGTRLGRQELDGELLTDTPGALWSLAMIEDARIRREELPDMRRIVVAIDPAATSGEDADETGIVVAGLGVDGKGYVLEDRSGRYTPTEWAREAVAAYHKHQADRIVAEVNNGGEMVENTIRVVDPNVAFRAVHASRGKATRAEPISALYEQSRVRHAGAFPLLETQMSEFTPGGMAGGGSPDRMDALVWAFTELMIGNDSAAIIEFYRRECEAAQPLGGGRMIEGRAHALARLRAPEGVSHAYTLSGECLAIPADRLVQVVENDIPPLLAAGFERVEISTERPAP